MKIHTISVISSTVINVDSDWFKMVTWHTYHCSSNAFWQALWRLLFSGIPIWCSLFWGFPSFHIQVWWSQVSSLNWHYNFAYLFSTCDVEFDNDFGDDSWWWTLAGVDKPSICTPLDFREKNLIFIKEGSIPDVNMLWRVAQSINQKNPCNAVNNRTSVT
jgi:hypothetical protein